MGPTRRQFLTAAAGFAVSQALLPHAGFGQDKKSTRVILLGTKGGPRLGESGRSNPSTLIMINDVPYVVDCAYGTSKQLIAAGVALNRVRYIFITHHHSDHNLDFGPLLYNAWITGQPARVDAYGPTGLNRMAVRVGRSSAFRSRALPGVLSRVRPRTLAPLLNSRGDSPA